MPASAYVAPCMPSAAWIAIATWVRRNKATSLRARGRWAASSDALLGAEETLRPHEQHDDQDDERGGELVVGVPEETTHLLDDTDDERADDGTGRRAETPEDHGGEQGEQEREADVELHVVRQAV